MFWNPLFGVFCTAFTSKSGFRNQFRTPSPEVRKPHFLRFGLPELLLKRKDFYHHHPESEESGSSEGISDSAPCLNCEHVLVAVKSSWFNVARPERTKTVRLSAVMAAF